MEPLVIDWAKEEAKMARIVLNIPNDEFWEKIILQFLKDP